jgi:hypothetical protein
VDRHWDIAGRLMERHSIPTERHMLLRENVATYLLHLPDEFVGKLEAGEVETRKAYAAGRETWRWADKMVTDLEKPYTDSEVKERVGQMDEELKVVAQQLMQHAGRKIHLVGSAVKGRLGGHSDLDAVAEGTSFHGKLLSVHSCGLKSFGTSVEIDPGAILESDVVSDLWQQTLEKKGLHLGENGEVTRLREVPREKEPVVDSGFFIPIGELP